MAKNHLINIYFYDKRDRNFLPGTAKYAGFHTKDAVELKSFGF